MFLKRLKYASLDDNPWVLAACYVGITTFLAFFVPTHWATWIHWGWLGIIGHFFAMALGVAFVWTMSFGFAELAVKDETGKKTHRSRSGAYAICIMAVLSASVALGIMAGAPVEPGDEEEWSHKVATEYRPPMPLNKRDDLIADTFWASLLPALFGVRCALGPKPKASED